MGNPTKYKALMPVIAELRDVEQKSLERIARDHGVSVATVHRAYDATHPDRVNAAIQFGQPMDRGRYSHLGGAKFNEIRGMLFNGDSSKIIAATVGCSIQTVNRTKKKMISDGELVVPPKPTKTTQDRARPKRRAGKSPESIKDEVVYLHDTCGLSLNEIAKRLQVTHTTATKALDLAHPEFAEIAIQSGDPIRRGPRSRLGQRKTDRIKELIGQGKRVCDIMAEVGCGRTTVDRFRDQIVGTQINGSQ